MIKTIIIQIDQTASSIDTDILEDLLIIKQTGETIKMVSGNEFKVLKLEVKDE